MALVLKELCLEAAEAVIDNSEAESRANRIATQAEKYEIQYASASSDEAKEAILAGLRKILGEDEDPKPKRGRPAKADLE